MGLKYTCLETRKHATATKQSSVNCVTHKNLKKEKKILKQEKCKEMHGGRKFCNTKRCFDNGGSVD